MANAPNNDNLIELHIRHTPGGAFTDAIFGDGTPSINAVKEKDIWPAIEILDGDDDTLLYMGKITEVSAEDFTIYSYDSLGNWERETTIEYEDIFCIQIFNKYTERFNSYVKSLLTMPST